MLRQDPPHPTAPGQSERVDSFPSIPFSSAVALVVADMIGTGVFTSLGFQLEELHSAFAILTLWILGGLLSLCGALSYGELGAAFPRSGGEYRLLGRIFHPALGFAAGLVSLTVGFPAPVALSAMAFGGYAARGLGLTLSPKILALALVVLVTLVHMGGIPESARFQNGATLLKIVLILSMIVAGMLAPKASGLALEPVPEEIREFLSPSFAVALVYVLYSYAGWNAAIYIAGELENPRRLLPLALITGTTFVTLLYVLFHAVLLCLAPPAVFQGQLEVAMVAGKLLFGPWGARIVAIALCLGLVSSVSAMVWAGPRVAMAMGEDLPQLRWLAKKNQGGNPSIATALQGITACLFLLSGTFSQVLSYIQWTLQLCSFLTVLGVMVLRYREPELPRPYRTWGYPWTPLLFLVASLWVLIHLLHSRPMESLCGAATLLAGVLVYYLPIFNQGARPPQNV
ncbi:APC family permease [Candidatus Methylacidithermus pantelleriae]|uniref:Amino acid permease-associated protein n=1 Tax=Candidatus Methylacidithermus pantelleriae TaxID=2744239 RepID=A0A8J2BRA7_9BACT|nr:amino acid permease [Candidatus Methylacidithermus pantelleriae]CAF0691426.1 Amino acid permease-associated protein [Candidatus Methylacidithermus pantelleriae]